MWTSLLFPKANAIAIGRSQLRTVHSKEVFVRHKTVKDPARQNPEYFEQEAEKLPMDEHYLDKLKYLYEEKVTSARDLSRKAADLLVADPKHALPEVDVRQPRIAYRNVDALRDAPDAVNRIFSVEFGERRDLTEAWRAEFISRVRAHELDNESLESKIAWATNFIRHHSALVDELIDKHSQKKHPKWAIRRLTLMIYYRRRLLKKLRETDRESFERVLSELKIAYTIRRDEDEISTRKKWSAHQVEKRCTAEKERRMKEYHKQLVEKREERVATIDAELEALNSEEAQVTKRLYEISLLEGRAVDDVRACYEPKFIEEFTELSIHQQLFYHPPPSVSSFRGAVATGMS